MPAAIPIAAAAVGAGISAVGSAAKVGKNTYRATNFGDSSQYDANRFRYGGQQGAASLAERYRQEALHAQARQGAQANYGRANDWEQQGLAARGEQGQIANLMHQRAAGAVPSIAQAQSARDIGRLGANSQRDIGLVGQNSARDIGLLGQNSANDIRMLNENAGQQMQRAQAAQASQAASARGAGGLALAQQGAANNIANAHGQIGTNAAMATRDIGRQSAMAAQNVGMAGAQAGQNIGMQAQMTGESIASQAQVNAMNERMQAEQAAFGAYSGMRGQDAAAQGFAGQQAQFNAGLQQQQRQLNDQYQLGYNQMEKSVWDQQAQLNATQQQMLSGSLTTQQGVNAGINQQNAKTESDRLNATMGMVSSAGMAGANGGAAPPAGQTGSDERMKEHVRDLGEAEDWPEYEGRTMHRDTPEDVRKVRRKYQDDAGRDADAYIAGMRRNLAQGASVARDEGELPDAPPPWLVAHMAGQQPLARDEGEVDQPPPRLARYMVSDDRAKQASYMQGLESGLLLAKSRATSPQNDEHPGSTERQKATYAPHDIDVEHAAPAKPPPTKKGLVTTSATRIDPKAHGEPPPKNWEQGGSVTARGRDMTPPLQGLPKDPLTGELIYPPAGPQPAPRPKDPAELAMVGGQAPYSDERTKQGAAPIRTPLASAARAMEGKAYAYKPDFTPPEQETGETNVGPMAQNMAKDPVAGTIVKKGPDGLLMLDETKMVKTLGAIVADQQRQNDDQQRQIATLRSRMRGSR